jgi:hypothetical protein
MEPDRTHDETELGELLGLLKPAPQAWVEAAKELPRIERGLDQILALAETDAEFRAALVEDLESAIERAGFTPEPGLVRGVRERLGPEG